MIKFKDNEEAKMCEAADKVKKAQKVLDQLFERRKCFVPHTEIPMNGEQEKGAQFHLYPVHRKSALGGVGI